MCTYTQTNNSGYLRALGAYQGVKKGYEYCRGFVGVRTVAPIVEWVAEGTLAKLPVIKNMKDEDSADGYPMLHGIDSRLLEMLREFDDYVSVCFVCMCVYFALLIEMPVSPN